MFGLASFRLMFGGCRPLSSTTGIGGEWRGIYISRASFERATSVPCSLLSTSPIVSYHMHQGFSPRAASFRSRLAQALIVSSSLKLFISGRAWDRYIIGDRWGHGYTKLLQLPQTISERTVHSLFGVNALPRSFSRPISLFHVLI